MRTAALVAVFSSSLVLAACRAASGLDQSAGPTYNKDIAPLLWQHCGACHRPEQFAPFSLLEYPHVREHKGRDLSARPSIVRALITSSARHGGPE